MAYLQWRLEGQTISYIGTPTLDFSMIDAKQEVMNLFESCSVHGFSHLVSTKRKVDKVIWCCMIMLGFSAAGNTKKGFIN